MAAALLPSLGLLHALAFLLRLSTASPSRGAPEPPPEHPAGCSPSPKACGGLNVSYPFWVEEPGRPPCGSPPFQLKCNASGAFLSHSVFQAYRVVAIFARNSSVHVVDENLPLAAGCPAPCFNISLAAMGLGVFAISQANSGSGSSPDAASPCQRLCLGSGACLAMTTRRSSGSEGGLEAAAHSTGRHHRAASSPSCPLSRRRRLQMGTGTGTTTSRA